MHCVPIKGKTEKASKIHHAARDFRWELKLKLNEKLTHTKVKAKLY